METEKLMLGLGELQKLLQKQNFQGSVDIIKAMQELKLSETSFLFAFKQFGPPLQMFPAIALC